MANDETPRLTLHPTERVSFFKIVADAFKPKDWLSLSAAPFVLFVQVNLKDSPSGWFNTHIRFR